MTSTSTCPYCRLIQLAAHEIVLCRGCGQLFNPNPPPGEKLLPLENLKEDELIKAWMSDTEYHGNQPVEIKTDVRTAICVVSLIQIACRRPQRQGVSREVAENFARHLERGIAHTPAIAEILRRGWDPQYHATPASS